MTGINGIWVRWLRNGFAGLALIMALVNVYFGTQMRALEDAVEAGRADMVKAQTLANVDNNVIQLLAKTAVEKNDADIKALLASAGVTFHAQPVAGDPGAPAPAQHPGAGQ